MSNPVTEIDASGLLCPEPLLALERAINSARPGALFRLSSTDPTSVLDVPAFCRANGHELLVQGVTGPAHTFLVQKSMEA